MGKFSGFSEEFFEFMIKLKMNNSTEFFNSVRGEYEAYVKLPLYALCADMEDYMRGINPTYETRPVRCVSRIRRDTRFTHDKTPYRTNMWIGWSARSKEKASAFGFYFDVGLDGYGYGAGFFGEPIKFMRALRPMLAGTPSRFVPALVAADAGGFTLNGDAYKRIDIPDMLEPALRELYVKKGFWFSREGNTAGMMSPGLVDELKAGYNTLVPIARAVEDISTE